MNIYVGNLDFNISEEELRGVFEEYGSVTEVKIITNKFSGRSKGFGFVVMDDEKEATAAIGKLNGATLENRQIIVNEARSRK
jgi:RNA recognition motif-containing protein